MNESTGSGVCPLPVPKFEGIYDIISCRSCVRCAKEVGTPWLEATTQVHTIPTRIALDWRQN